MRKAFLIVAAALLAACSSPAAPNSAPATDAIQQNEATGSGQDTAPTTECRSGYALADRDGDGVYECEPIAQ